MQPDTAEPARQIPPRQVTTVVPTWKRYVNGLLAKELSRLTRYYDCVIQWLPRKEDAGILLAGIDAPKKQVIGEGVAFPDLTSEETRRTAVLINGTFNHHFDIQGLLLDLKPKLARTARILVVLYNPYLRWLYVLANQLRIRNGDVPGTFITKIDLDNIAKISGFEVIQRHCVAYVPWRLFGLGTLVNRVMTVIPGVRWIGFTLVVTMRPIIATAPIGLSCVIPARNERGNIENALHRLPNLGCPIEVIFVEGHSTDGTWDEIQRVARIYGDRFRIQTLQQTGVGKADAVRLGFEHASHPLLTILDADLTMPPEMLSRFYNAYCQGCGDFVNGSRLVYPMEGDAMRFLNRLGNIFFAKSLSWVLDASIGDTLCGTKLLARHDYERFVGWRRDFGDFDPFGDFELLFPAAIMGIGMVDIPVRYLARRYGSTNISRFQHGLQLGRMILIGLFRIKLGFEHGSSR